MRNPSSVLGKKLPVERTICGIATKLRPVDLELVATAMAAGGDAIARDDDGRVVFVEGALPGERVRARVVQAKKDFARAVVVDVVSPSADRVEPSCDPGCSGCTWQH